jgi:hypothetical protein
MSDLSRTTEEASQVRKEGQQTANDSYQGTETLHRTLVSSRTCGAKVEKGRIYTSHATVIEEHTGFAIGDTADYDC